MKLTPAPDTSHIAITLYSNDRREAAEIANAVAEAYQDFYVERQKAKAGKAVAQVVTILDTAEPAARPCKPNKPLNLALGAVVARWWVASLVGMLNRRS